MKYILVLLLMFFSAVADAKPRPEVQSDIRASVMVRVGDEVSGSGVAIAHYKEGTIFATNDHVCQWSRGARWLIQKPNLKGELNTLPTFVTDEYDRVFRAKVIYTTNVDNDLHKSKYEDDICLLYVPGYFPLVKMADENSEVGQEVFSVSAPHQFFPYIESGYIGEYEDVSTGTASLKLNHGSSGGGIFDKDTGELVGLAFAIHVTDDKSEAALLTYYLPVARISFHLNNYLSLVKK